MIIEDYVSFNVAKLLKEKGFNEACHTFYDNGHKHILKFVQKGLCNNAAIIANNGICVAPTLQMAMKWLREIHGLFIHIDIIREASCWLVDIQDIKGDVAIYPIKDEFPKYEEACKAAIKYCLENLI